MTDFQQFPNTYAQPLDYDTTLAAEYLPGAHVLVVDQCPPGVLITGPIFQVKVGHTLFKVTDLGSLNTHWAVPDGPVENTSDDTYPVGEGVSLELTRGAVETIRDAPFLTVDDESGNGFPNSRKPLLTDDTDVLITSPADGDVLTYDVGTSKWKNEVGGGGGGSSTLAGLTDVHITSPGDAELLAYDGTLHKWKNVSPHDSGAGLEVVTTPLPVIRSGEIIVSGLLSSDIVIVPGGQAPPDCLTTEDGTDYLYEDVVFPPEPVTTPDNMNWIYG